MDDYFALQPTGIHEDGLPTSTAREGYTSPLDSPEESTAEAAAPPGADSDEKAGARTKAVLSPSELVSVLDQGLSPPPKPDAREFERAFPSSRLAASTDPRSTCRLLTRRTSTLSSRCALFCTARLGSRRHGSSVLETYRNSEVARLHRRGAGHSGKRVGALVEGARGKEAGGRQERRGEGGDNLSRDRRSR